MNISDLAASCGAISHPGRTVITVPEGIYCQSTPFPAAATGFPRRARFVWLDPEKFPDHQLTPATFFVPHEPFKFGAVLLEKEFDFSPEDGPAILRLTADRSYRLYVNGAIAGRGPAAVGGDYGDRNPAAWYFYDTYDLSDKLKDGRNTIRVEVMLITRVQTDYSTGHAGLLAELEQKGVIILCTDRSWRATLDPRMVSPDRYDFTLPLPPWAETVELAPEIAGRWHLLSSPVPVHLEADVAPAKIHQLTPRVEKTTGDGWRVSPGIPFAFDLEFAEETAGFFSFLITAPESLELKLEYCENPGFVHRLETVRLAPGLNAYRGWRLDVFQYVRVTLPRLNSELKIHRLNAVYSSFPVTYAGSFTCSDPSYNQFWLTGRRTLQMCMQSCFLDSPIHQEALGCTGDYLIESLLAYAMFGETILAAADLRRTKYYLEHNRHQMFHTSYSLLWVEMLREYYRYTGDVGLVRELLPEAKELLKTFAGYRDESGLIVNAPSYMFMDWVDSAGYQLHHPPAAIGMGYMTAFYCRALSDLAELQQALGEDAAAAEQECGEVKAAIRRELFDAALGIFKDGIAGITGSVAHRFLPSDPPGDPPPTYSEQTNAAIIWAGVVTPEEGRNIFARLESMPDLPPVQPYFMHFVFEALTCCGGFEPYGFNRLNRFQQLYDLHPSTWAEAWDFGDFCHAWSATSGWQLSTAVLGVRNWTPGFHSVEISPLPGTLTWAAGVFPTVHGPLEIKWERAAGNRLHLQVRAPAAINISIIRPDGLAGFTAELNGKEVQDSGCRVVG